MSAFDPQRNPVISNTGDLILNFAQHLEPLTRRSGFAVTKFEIFEFQINSSSCTSIDRGRDYKYGFVESI